MVTEDAVPVVQRLVVGAEVKDPPCDDPQEPEIGDALGGTCGDSGVGSGVGVGGGIGAGAGLRQTLLSFAREREPKIPFAFVSPAGTRISSLYFS